LFKLINVSSFVLCRFHTLPSLAMSFNIGQDSRFVIHAMASQELLAYLFTNLMKQ